MRCLAVRRRAAMASRVVGRSSECCKQQGCERIGLLAPTMTFLFPGSLRGLTVLPAPGPLRVRVHPLVSFSSASEFQPLRTCPRSELRRRLPWGLVPLRDIRSTSPLASEHPKLALRSALSVSHALDGFLLVIPCGFVSPRSHVRDSPFRGFIPPPSRPASSAARALLSLCDSRLPSSCLAGASSSRLASRAFIRAAIRGHPSECLAPPTPRSPPRFPAPSGFSSNTLEAPSCLLRSRPRLPGPACDPGRWSSAYQSMSDPVFCPQSTIPFELPGLPCSPASECLVRGPVCQAVHHDRRTIAGHCTGCAMHAPRARSRNTVDEPPRRCRRSGHDLWTT